MDEDGGSGVAVGEGEEGLIGGGVGLGHVGEGGKKEHDGDFHFRFQSVWGAQLIATFHFGLISTFSSLWSWQLSMDQAKEHCTLNVLIFCGFHSTVQLINRGSIDYFH